MKSLPLYDTILEIVTERFPSAMKLTKLFILLLIAGLIVRIMIALWSFNFRENTDVLRYRDWATIAYLHGFEKTYESTYLTFGTLANNQPPGSVYILYSAYEVNLVAAKILLRVLHETPGNLHWMNSSLINFFLRLPSILCDILIAVLIYIFVKKRTGEKPALLSSSFFFLNPIVIYNSSFWGQMDSINNLLFLISLLLLLKNRISLALTTFFLSLYVKVSLIFVLPFFILFAFLLLKKNSIKLIKSLLSASGVILIATLPVSKEPWLWIFNFLSKNAVGEIQNITVFAFNFWWFVFKPIILIGKPTDLFSFSEIRLVNSPFSGQVLFGVPLGILGIMLFLLSIAPFFYIIRDKIKFLQKDELFLLCSLTFLLGFLFLPQMHERYMYPVFPILALYYGLTKKFLLSFWLLSIFHLFNLYFVWHPFQISFLSYSLLINQEFQWAISFAIVGVSGWLYFQTIKTVYAKKA